MNENFDTFFTKFKLINANRIDIIIGIEYVDYYENKYNTNFFIDLYIEHKRAFNNLYENNWSKTWDTDIVKKGKISFLNTFNNLIDNIKLVKTNKVPIPIYYDNNSFWIEDGFHRASILFYYDFLINKDIILKPIPIKICDYYPTNIYFFKNKNYQLKYCNYTMYNFFKNYYKDFHCIILFPNEKVLARNLLDEIKKYIIYDIDIPIDNFKNNFKNNFIQLLYYNEEWCKNGGYKEKANFCFNNNITNLKIYIIEKLNLDTLVDYKKKVRQFFKKGNHSIHIPDNQEECNLILDLLNENTLDFINKTPSLYINFKNFNKLFNRLKVFCKENNINTKKICVTSYSVLSIYGLQDCDNMDLFIDKKYIDIFKNTDFNNHNNYTINKKYSKHFEDIIYNPDNHFYFQGIKFCNYSIIENFLKIKDLSNSIKENINKFANKNNFDCCKEIDYLINKTHLDIGMVIIWDINYNNQIIEEILKIENTLELIYSEKIETTLQFTINLLREIHIKKVWWEENLEQESKKRSNGNLIFHIFQGENIHKIFKNLKNTIRDKFQLDKYIFHFSDPDCISHIGIKCQCESDRIDFLSEVYKHINLLMNKNTIYFLKNSKYNKNLKFHKYFNEYCDFLSKNNFNNDNFLIDNSGVLALYGLRDAKDLDFITIDNIKCNEKNVDCMNYLHINEFKKLKLNIETIIKNPEYHFYHYNKKVLDIKLLKKFKFNRTQNIVEGQSKIREKDINDYKMICDNFIL